MNQRELKKSILDDPNLTNEQKNCKLNELCEPYVALSDEALLQLVREFKETNGREPTQQDLLYSRELKARFGPWPRMLEQAGTRPVAQSYLDRKRRLKEKRARKRNKVVQETLPSQQEDGKEGM